MGLSDYQHNRDRPSDPSYTICFYLHQKQIKLIVDTVQTVSCIVTYIICTFLTWDYLFYWHNIILERCFTVD